MGRARHEARWTAEDATVTGRTGNRGWWMIAAGFVLIAALTTLTFNRFMNFQDVTFELRTCSAPLAADATWEQVMAADCQAASTEGLELSHWQEGSRRDPAETTTTGWVFDRLPVNTVANALELRTEASAETVVLADSGAEKIRRAMSSDSAGLRWSASLGDRGPTTYWVLVTPAG